MKINGNLTRLVNIIIVDGWSAGGEESKRPKSEKKKQASVVTPTIRTTVNMLGVINSIIRKIGIEHEIKAKANDATVSPRSIAQSGTGKVSRRSNV